MQVTEATSDKTDKAWQALCTSLGKRGATVGKLFGMTCLKTITGKAFAGIFGDALVFKLASATHAKALALKGAVLFDPSGKGRPMKAWVVVPKAHAKHWTAFAKAAFSALGE